MSLFALDPLWNDFYTAGGFWVGVLGTVVGVAGFWIAITQIRETRKVAEAGKLAAEAAQEAAENTLAESKESYERFVGAFASRLLSELQRAVFAREWDLAVVRTQDVAELLGTLPDAGDRVEMLVKELRVFGQKFATRNVDGAPTFAPTKWNALVNDAHLLLDRLRAPFRRTNPARETTDADRPRTEIDCGNAAPENAEG